MKKTGGLYPAPLKIIDVSICNKFLSLLNGFYWNDIECQILLVKRNRSIVQEADHLLFSVHLTDLFLF